MAALTLPCTGVGKAHMCVLCPWETMAVRFAHVLLWLQGGYHRGPVLLMQSSTGSQDLTKGPKLPVATLVKNLGP